MRRRKFIKTSMVGLGAYSFVGPALFAGRVTEGETTQDPFSRTFVVPPIDTGKRDGRRVHFNLNIAAGETNFVGDLATPTLGINQSYLGPVLRVKRGDRVSFAVKNQLQETTTLHWHGLILPAEMDGGPHQVIEPGKTWRPQFDVVQPASSCWYHSHQHKKTGEHVYHGLGGMFVIDDEVSLKAGLPNDYGVDDLPVVIQDRAFHRDGTLRYLGSMPDRMHGMHGDKILVNGVLTPTLEAERGLLRLRILNASNARFYNLTFSDERTFMVIAGDGGFLPSPIKVQEVRVAPGERAEILVDLSDGKDVVLANRAGSAPRGRGMGRGMMNASNESFDILKIDAPKASKRGHVDAAKFSVPLPDWKDAKPATTRQFQLEMQMGPSARRAMMRGESPFSISGKSMDMNVINHRVKSNTVEIWEVVNSSMLAHPFHIHDTQFKVLHKSGSEISACETGLKDTVVVNPQEKVRLLVPFPEYSDSKRPYMYHCHILEHEDAGMMGQFTVEA